MEPEFKDWLERQIKLRNWSQAEFSRRGGVSTSQVSQFLTGSRGAGELLYRATAAALEMPLGDVLKVAGVLPQNGSKPYPVEGLHIAQVIEGLTPVQRQEVLDFIEFMKDRDKKRARG